MTDDTRLIAETSKLEQVWRKCTSHDRWEFAESGCLTCHGTGKVPFIDASNILWAEAWFFKSKYTRVRISGPIRKIHAMAIVWLLSAISEYRDDPAKRVAESKRIIAAAIQEAEKGEG